jgi:TetR/AcrR family transcriptional repressor of mexJK operon
MSTVTSQTRRRGRPPRSQEAAITDRIVLAARELFLSQGYDATAMVRIGEAAQVSPGTLYARFPDKAAVFRAVVQYQVGLWKQDPPPAEATCARTLREVLEEEALRLIAALSRPEVVAFSRLMNAESTRFPELARIYSDDALRPWSERVTRRILAAPERVHLGREEAEALALALMEAVLGWSQLRGIQRDASTTGHSAAQRIAELLARSTGR